MTNPTNPPTTRCWNLPEKPQRQEGEVVWNTWWSADYQKFQIFRFSYFSISENLGQVKSRNPYYMPSTGIYSHNWLKQFWLSKYNDPPTFCRMLLLWASRCSERSGSQTLMFTMGRSPTSTPSPLQTGVLKKEKEQKWDKILPPILIATLMFQIRSLVSKWASSLLPETNDQVQINVILLSLMWRKLFFQFDTFFY